MVIPECGLQLNEINKHMMKPRLQMRTPYTHDIYTDKYIGAASRLARSGIFKGIAEAWESCIRMMYDEFDASFAANEGIEAVIRDLAPSRRRLTVSKIDRSCYSIECEQGGRLYLTATDDDSIILSFGRWQSCAESSIDLACYDSNEAARFIGNAFKAYRKIQENVYTF